MFNNLQSQGRKIKIISDYFLKPKIKIYQQQKHPLQKTTPKKQKPTHVTFVSCIEGPNQIQCTI